MKLYGWTSRIALSIILSACQAALTPGQDLRREDREFRDPGGKWTITLKDNWEPTVYQDGAGNTVVDIIYDNREEGILRIRPLSADQGVTAEEAASREQESAHRFRPGFTRGKFEPFSGALNGTVLNFEFTSGGRRKTARYYYLKASDTLFYVLRFEGRPEVLRSLRNRNDLMARSFRQIS